MQNQKYFGKNREYFAITHREIEILDLISFGLSTTDIAKSLYISFETVKSHRKNLLQKAGVKNVAALVRWGMECRLIEMRVRA